MTLIKKVTLKNWPIIVQMKIQDLSTLKIRNEAYKAFDRLYIGRQFSNSEYSDVFLKHSNENGDKYYADFKSDITRFSDTSCSEYASKYEFILNLRCQALRELVIDFGGGDRKSFLA
ncbi:hypothetical protein EDC94DRAFT_590758 [Helicostylum pulchrum]|nr:hypothetical protein EDC94DRAFT_590758 [Helicostylum pulchrum]